MDQKVHKPRSTCMDLNVLGFSYDMSTGLVNMHVNPDIMNLPLRTRTNVLKDILILTEEIEDMWKTTNELVETVEDSRTVFEATIELLVEEIGTEVNPYLASLIEDAVRSRAYLEFPELNPKGDVL